MQKWKMDEHMLGTVLIVVTVIIAFIVAVYSIPKPTGDSSVYDAYVEDMRQHGRKPNGEPIK